MEVQRNQDGALLVVRVSGRLDAYWADHLASELEQAIREGADQLRLDMQQVTFLSSAGLRVLLTTWRELRNIQGSFSIRHASDPVRQVLSLAGFESLLEEAGEGASGAAVDRAPAPAPAAGRREDRPEAVYEVFPLAPGARLAGAVVGDPGRLDGCRLGSEDCRTVRFPETTVGLGLGAFGSGFEDCRHRFGEFLAVAGAVAYMPTDGTNVPDFLAAAGSLAPEVEVLYGATLDGTFSHHSRFEAKRESGAASLSRLTRFCLETAGEEAVGIVLLAESAGLVGASLRRSPVAEPAAIAASPSGPGPALPPQQPPFAFPGIRGWLSFSPDRTFLRSLTLAAGIAAWAPAGPLAALLRPLGDGLSGHFHAASFSYRPIPRGELDLRATIGALFEAGTLQGVLHLLHDDRPISGGGESEFVRGACWFGPIAPGAAA